MLYRRFGRTGLNLSVFSCGGMRAQQSWNRSAAVSEVGQTKFEATIARALEVGINHFETARGYGTSEAQFGRALSKHPRDSFVLQTKLRPNDDPHVFETQLEEAFALLGTDRVDLFSFHGLNTRSCVEQTLRPGGCWEVADRFRKLGRIAHIGFSTHAPTALILEAVESNRFDYINVHYYYIFQDNLAALQAATRHDMGIFIISPSDKGGRLYKAPARLRELCAPLSPLVFNDLWCLSQSEIGTLSLGAARPSDFDEHIEALALLDRAPELLPPIVERLEAAYRDAVGEDFAARWRTGLREWHDLPGLVNVRRILWLDNLVRAFDLVAYAQERYAAMSPTDHWVPGARAADFDEAAIVAALPDSPFGSEIPGRLREAHTRLYNPAARPMP